VSNITNPNAENYVVTSIATYYPQIVTLYVPNRAYDKIFTGRDTRDKGLSIRHNPEKTVQRSLRRTKKKIKDYVRINKFDLFTTFTFKDDRENVEKSKQKMSDWLKNQQKRTGKFEYLIVPEFHKDKKAIHFHALIKNYGGKLETAINPLTKRSVVQKGKQIYTFPSYKSGFSNAVKIDTDNDSHTKVALYLSKYITKDTPVFSNKNRYWASFGLLLPETEDNPEWYGKIKPLNQPYGIDYGVIYTFSAQQIKDYYAES